MNFARAIADRVMSLEGREVVGESSEPGLFFDRSKTQRARQFPHTFPYDESPSPSNSGMKLSSAVPPSCS